MTNQPGILLLHGALGSAEQLKDLSVALKDLHPMIVEFTGHGKHLIREFHGALTILRITLSVCVQGSIRLFMCLVTVWVDMLHCPCQ